MKKKYLLFLSLFFYYFCFGQSEIQLKGKIVSEKSSIANAEIINATSKKVVVSNEVGEFTIQVQRGDMLVVVAKNCFEKQIYLSTSLLSQPKLIIEITKKTIELDEVIVRKETLVSQAEIGSILGVETSNTTRQANQMGVYTGETVGGLNLVALGKLIGKLFKKKKKQPRATVNFKEYIAENIDEAFLHKTLKLNDTDYYRFLEFCEADPNVNKLIAEDNQFTIINFLFDKKAAFDKL